jgi:hypothetical protein
MRPDGYREKQREPPERMEVIYTEGILPTMLITGRMDTGYHNYVTSYQPTKALRKIRQYNVHR